MSLTIRKGTKIQLKKPSLRFKTFAKDSDKNHSLDKGFARNTKKASSEVPRENNIPAYYYLVPFLLAYYIYGLFPISAIVVFPLQEGLSYKEKRIPLEFDDSEKVAEVSYENLKFIGYDVEISPNRRQSSLILVVGPGNTGITQRDNLCTLDLDEGMITIFGHSLEVYGNSKLATRNIAPTVLQHCTKLQKGVLNTFNLLKKFLVKTIETTLLKDKSQRLLSSGRKVPLLPDIKEYLKAALIEDLNNLFPADPKIPFNKLLFANPGYALKPMSAPAIKVFNDTVDKMEKLSKNNRKQKTQLRLSSILVKSLLPQKRGFFSDFSGTIPAHLENKKGLYYLRGTDENHLMALLLQNHESKENLAIKDKIRMQLAGFITITPEEKIKDKTKLKRDCNISNIKNYSVDLDKKRTLHQFKNSFETSADKSNPAFMDDFITTELHNNYYRKIGALFELVENTGVNSLKLKLQKKKNISLSSLWEGCTKNEVSEGYIPTIEPLPPTEREQMELVIASFVGIGELTSDPLPVLSTLPIENVSVTGSRFLHCINNSPLISNNPGMNPSNILKLINAVHTNATLASTLYLDPTPLKQRKDSLIVKDGLLTRGFYTFKGPVVNLLNTKPISLECPKAPFKLTTRPIYNQQLKQVEIINLTENQVPDDSVLCYMNKDKVYSSAYNLFSGVRNNKKLPPEIFSYLREKENEETKAKLKALLTTEGVNFRYNFKSPTYVKNCMESREKRVTSAGMHSQDPKENKVGGRDMETIFHNGYNHIPRVALALGQINKTITTNTTGVCEEGSEYNEGYRCLNPQKIFISGAAFNSPVKGGESYHLAKLLALANKTEFKILPDSKRAWWESSPSIKCYDSGTKHIFELNPENQKQKNSKITATRAKLNWAKITPPVNIPHNKELIYSQNLGQDTAYHANLRGMAFRINNLIQDILEQEPASSNNSQIEEAYSNYFLSRILLKLKPQVRPLKRYYCNNPAYSFLCSKVKEVMLNQNPTPEIPELKNIKNSKRSVAAVLEAYLIGFRGIVYPFIDISTEPIKVPLSKDNEIFCKKEGFESFFNFSPNEKSILDDRPKFLSNKSNDPFSLMRDTTFNVRKYMQGPRKESWIGTYQDTGKNILKDVVSYWKNLSLENCSRYYIQRCCRKLLGNWEQTKIDNKLYHANELAGSGAHSYNKDLDYKGSLVMKPPSDSFHPQQAMYNSAILSQAIGEKVEKIIYDVDTTKKRNAPKQSLASSFSFIDEKDMEPSLIDIIVSSQPGQDKGLFPKKRDPEESNRYDDRLQQYCDTLIKENPKKMLTPWEAYLFIDSWKKAAGGIENQEERNRFNKWISKEEELLKIEICANLLKDQPHTSQSKDQLYNKLKELLANKERILEIAISKTSVFDKDSTGIFTEENKNHLDTFLKSTSSVDKKVAENLNRLSEDQLLAKETLKKAFKRMPLIPFLEFKVHKIKKGSPGQLEKSLNEYQTNILLFSDISESTIEGNFPSLSFDLISMNNKESLLTKKQLNPIYNGTQASEKNQMGFSSSKKIFKRYFYQHQKWKTICFSGGELRISELNFNDYDTFLRHKKKTSFFFSFFSKPAMKNYYQSGNIYVRLL